MKIDKVEIHKDYVIKKNISNSTDFFQKITEFFNIQFKRELRVYNYYPFSKSNHLLIPKLLEVGDNYIKIERLYESSNYIETISIIPNLKEFLLLGKKIQKFHLTDFFASPAFNVIRGSLFGVFNYGFRQHTKILIYIVKMSFDRKNHDKLYLIHKDLHLNDTGGNIVNTEKGVYFYDFGSSILTKRYFLTDVIQLSIDFPKLEFDIIPVFQLLKSLGYDQDYLRAAKIQIKIILYKRFLHLSKIYKENYEYMSKAKIFIAEIDNLISKLDEHEF